MMKRLVGVLVCALVLAPFGAMADTALTVVTGETYDFEFKAMTANITDGDSAADLKLEFLHRDTFEIYYATITALPAKGAWVSAKYDFPTGIDIEDMKWIKLQLTGTSLGDAWAVDEIEIYDATGTLYYEFDEDDDGYEARPFIDGCIELVTNVFYAEPMIQILPTPDLHADEAYVKIEMSTGSKVCGVSDVKFHFYPQNDSTVETYNAVDLNATALATNSTYEYVTPLNQRLGNYRKYAVQNTGTSALKVEDVKLYTKHDGGVWKLYTERDINDDGYDWSETFKRSGQTDQSILGASSAHTWEATLSTTDVVISNFFQGSEVWTQTVGTAAAEASTYQTVDAATAGTSGDYNVIESSFYKVESGNTTATDFTTAMNDAAALDYTHVRYMVDTGISPSSGSIIKYDTGGSVLVHQVDASHSSLKMHNKLVLVKDTADGAAVLYGSSNLGTGTHGRWQVMTRISGIYDLWEGYDKYFANILKYHPSTNLADINHDHNTDANYFEGTPNNGSEFSETQTPSTGSSSNLPWVHELGSAYDISPITLGGLEVETWCYPRVSTDQPIATELAALNTWLSGDSSRRAEVYAMHLYFFSTTAMPNDIADELIDLHTSTQADLFVGTALNGDILSSNDMRDPRISTNVATELEHTRFAGVQYQVHSKWIALKKWHLDGSNNRVDDGFILMNGSRNMTDISLTERDETVTKIEWTASAGTASREFEQYVYRPYADVFKRFYNHYDLSLPVGSEMGSCTESDDHPVTVSSQQ